MTPIQKAASAMKLSLGESLDSEQRRAIDFKSLTCVHAVRAVLASLREPSEAMVKAGMIHEATDLASEYRAMIDAALEEGP